MRTFISIKQGEIEERDAREEMSPKGKERRASDRGGRQSKQRHHRKGERDRDGKVRLGYMGKEYRSSSLTPEQGRQVAHGTAKQERHRACQCNA